MNKEVDILSATYAELVRLLENSICNIEFIKADGSQRKMSCTLNPFTEEMEVLADDYNNSTKESITVWDLEKKDWRSFRKDRLTKCTVTTSILEVASGA
jgi:hypothetical protein